MPAPIAIAVAVLVPRIPVLVATTAPTVRSAPWARDDLQLLDDLAAITAGPPPLALPSVLVGLAPRATRLDALLYRVGAQRPHRGSDHRPNKLIAPVLGVAAVMLPVARELDCLSRRKPADKRAEHAHSQTNRRVRERVVNELLGLPDRQPRPAVIRVIAVTVLVNASPLYSIAWVDGRRA